MRGDIKDLLSRQDTHSSSAVPARPIPMPVSSRSPQYSCWCWTACGRCGVSSRWLWVSLRRCFWGWRMRFTRPTTAPSCVTAIRRGQSLSLTRHWDLLTDTKPDSFILLILPCATLFSFRCALGVTENTHCLFQALLRPMERDYYSNPLYEPTELAIWPSVHPQSLQLWRGKFWLVPVLSALDPQPVSQCFCYLVCKLIVLLTLLKWLFTLSLLGDSLTQTCVW